VRTADHLPGLNSLSLDESDYRRPAEPSYSQSEADITDQGESQALQASTLASECNDDDSDLCLSERLWRAIENKMQSKEKRFIPKGKLEAIVNVDSVESELRRCGADKLIKDGRSVRSYAEEIYEGHAGCHGPGREGDGRCRFRKIFALVVLSDQTSSIFDFLREHICDSDLPLRTHSQSMDQFLLYRKDEEDWRKHIQFLAEWHRSSRTSLENDQWGMLSPVFTVGEYGHIERYELDDRDVLPFTRSSHEVHRQLAGGFGEVTRVNIDPSHHNFYQGRFRREVGRHTIHSHKLNFWAAPLVDRN
jgi:hypothetical protein